MNLKRKHALIIVLLVAVLLISAFGIKELISDGTPDGTGQPSQTPSSPSPQSSPSSSSAPTSSPSPTASPSPLQYQQQCQQLLNQAIAVVEHTRNVTLPQVELFVVNKTWAIQNWGEAYANPDLQNIQREEKIYKGLFVIPENSSLYQANVDWAGYFVSAVWNGNIYVVQENFDPWKSPDAESTFVHELTHVMQSQLPTPSGSPTFDGDRARTALTEGDANYMQDLFKNQTIASQTSAITSPIPTAWILLGEPLLQGLYPSLPSSISDFDYFPYTYGPQFVGALYAKGGWALVNQAYADPPNTTAQILHPEKYFAGEDAQQVAAPTLTETSWVQEKNERYGEYFVQVMLGNWLPQNEAQTAAEGWSGDNLTYYERGTDYLFTWNITWNSAHAASQFSSSFQNMMNATNATKENGNDWYANGRYLSFTWSPNSNLTTIVGSSNETSALQSPTG
jgi:hypothetical protein